MPNYWIWTEYEEVATRENQFSMGSIADSFGSGIHMGDRDMGNVNWEDKVNHYQEMVFDAAGPEFGMCS